VAVCRKIPDLYRLLTELVYTAHTLSLCGYRTVQEG
jgi:hypothetical protein